MKRIFTFALAAMAMMGVQKASAQTEYKILSDLTSKIQNADFTADPPTTVTIRTYDYDMPDQLGAGAGGSDLFGQQAITGWTAANPTDNIYMPKDTRTDGANARAAGIFDYIDDESTETSFPGLGGAYYAPYIEEGFTGPGLGLVAVWGAGITCSQDVDLPAGGYMLVVQLQNTAGSTAVLESYNGFVYNNGEKTIKHESELLQYQTSTWINDTITFLLKEAASGQVTLGYKSGNWGSSSAPHLFIDNVKLYSIDPTPLQDAEVVAAKEELLAVINEGRDLGVDVSAALAVYNNPGATVEQVKKAIEDQKAANAAGTTDFSPFFITNPHFSLDDPITDGITTYDYDMEDPNGSNGRKVEHYGMQPVQGWEASNMNENARASGVFAIGSDAWLGGGAFTPPTSMSDGSTEGNLLGFVSVWTATSQYTQQVTIPDGTYTLTISYYNGGGTGAIAKNLMGFVTNDGFEYLCQETTFKVNSWETMTVKFTLDEPTSGYFSVGYEATNSGSASMPHLFIDGISLRYVGTGVDFDPSLIALEAAVSSATNSLDEYFQQSLKDELREVVSAGAALVSSQSKDADANKEAADAINNLLGEAKASIKAYNALQEFYDGELQELIEQYEEDLPGYYERLNDLNDQIMEQLNDEPTWSAEEINEVLGSVNAMYKEEVQKAWDEAIASGKPLKKDLDISVLFEQLAYTYSSTAQSNTNVPDKEWKYGDANNFKTQYGTAEVWNQTPFEVSRTISDLPAGKYTVTTRAYYRTASNTVNYESYDPSNELAFVFAGHNKTALTNVVEIANPSADAFVGNANIGTEEEPLYVPNNQQAAHDVFENDAYADKLEKSVSTVVATDGGDLTFGVKADQMEGDCWVVWYTFSITYNALEDDLLNNEITALIEEANNAIDEGAGNVIAAQDGLSSASDKGEKALGGSTADKVAAVTALTDAIDYAGESVKLAEQLDEVFNDYLNKMTESDISSSDETLTNLIDAVSDGMNDGFKDNPTVQGYIDQFPKAWAAYVLGQDGFADATGDTPVDITGIIINAAFDMQNANYWTITTDSIDDRIGQNQGYQNNNEYTSEDGQIVVNQFIEAWRPNGETLHNGNVGQTLNVTLPAGYYTLEADAYATNQKAIPEEGIQGAYLMANNNGNYYLTPIGIAVAGAAPEHFTVDFYSDGVNPTTVGLRVEDTNASWIVADNFQLKYIGTEAPVGIKDIETAETTVDLKNAKNIYSITGQRLNHVQKGINIVDGKKVLIK